MTADEASHVAQMPDGSLVEEGAVACGLVHVDDLGGRLLPDFPTSLPEAPLQLDLLDVERREGFVEAPDVVPCFAADQEEGAKRPVDLAGRIGLAQIVVGRKARRWQQLPQRCSTDDRTDRLGKVASGLLIRAIEIA